MARLLKLNLGCGDKHWPGFVNIDGSANSRSAPDLVHDFTKPLPYDDGSVDEVHAIHIIEHFYRWEVPTILADWCRVLKPGGLMVLECPSLERVLAAFNYYINEGKPLNTRMTMWGLYGDPGYREQAMTHRWCYPSGELMELMENAGMSVTLHKAQFHQPARDMRLQGVKHGTNV